jgi:hypothetical protein
MKAVEMGISLHRGAVRGTWKEVASLLGMLRDGKRRLWKQSVSIYGSCASGTWRGGGSFTGDCMRHVIEGLEMEHLSLYIGSLSGTWRESSCTEDFERHTVEGSGNRAFLFLGAP